MVTGKIAVVQKDIGGGDDDPDKPDPTKPDAVSRFDGVAMYDGEGHTIDTNAILSAFGEAMIGANATRTWYVRAQDGNGTVAPTSGWASETPATFKYRDSANTKVANYVVTVKGGQTLKVTVGGDQISVAADSETWAYDGEEHTKPSWTFVNESKLLAGHEFQIKIADASKIATPKDGLGHNGIVSKRHLGGHARIRQRLRQEADVLQDHGGWLRDGD